MNQNEREHEFYAAEDRRVDPKEYFKLINEVLKTGQKSWKTLCDIGCASGDFLYYMQTQNRDEDKEFVGIDNFDKLLRVAKKRVPGCEFLKGDIWSGEGMPQGRSFDVVCMLGVLSLFDDFKYPFRNLINLTHPGGSVLVFSAFNSHGCHVEHKYTIRGESGRLIVYSQEEIGQWLEEQGYTYEFIPFQLTVQLNPNKDNPLRTYTVALMDGTNGIINNAGMWFEQYLLKIDV